MSQRALLMYGEPLVIGDSADFDATNDYMSRGAGLTGAADSKTGILSVWFRLDASDASLMYFISNTTGSGPALNCYRSTDNKIYIQAMNASATDVLFVNTPTTYLAGATWRHLLASWNLATAGARSIYVNDVSDLTEVTFTDDSIDYTVTDWFIGANNTGGSKFDGCLAEFYFAPGQYLDFSIVANRRRFISGSGKPVFLGTTGSMPTGTAPLVYLHLDNAEAVANFATNRGTGGNFTITGTLDTGSTSPSD